MNNVTTFRAAIVETILVAIIIAVGVNVFSSGSIFGYGGLVPIIFGLLSIVIGVSLIFKRSLPNINRKYLFTGVFTTENVDNEIIDIPRYELANRMKKSFEGLFVENKVYKSSWKEPRQRSVFVYNKKDEFKNLPFFNRTIIECMEYVVLEILSLHLSAYFGEVDFSNEDKLTVLERSDIPTVLLTNKFLELFSRPMEEREAFQAEKREDEGLYTIKRSTGRDDEGTIVSAYSKSGAIFHRFELVLPKSTKIYRQNNNTICIKNRRFEIIMNPMFHGFQTNSRTMFPRMYLNRDLRKIDLSKIDLELKIKFSYLTLLTGRGWEYMRWIESFVEKMENAFSFDKFIENIGWETALTSEIIRVNEIRRRKEKMKNIDETHPSSNTTSNDLNEPKNVIEKQLPAAPSSSPTPP